MTPQIAVLGLGETRRLLAKAYDPEGALILTGVSYTWSVSPEAARLASVAGQGPAAVVEARDKEGETKVRVRGQLKGVERWGEATIKVMKSRNEYGFPPPEPVHDPLGSWRSRYRAERGVVEYNTGHRDYERARQPGQKGVIRYLAKLYAKELVLLNFPAVTPAMLLEYMVEVSSRVEANL